MSLFADFLKQNLRIQSPYFLLEIVAFGVVLLYLPRTRVWGRRWLTAAIVGYWCVSTPMGSWLLSEPLARTATRIESREQAAGARMVVVLGGGTFPHVADNMGIDDLRDSALRVIEGARLYHLLGDATIVVSGGNPGHMDMARPEAAGYLRAIEALGVPGNHVIIEDESHTTREEAVILKRLFASLAVDRFVLVTSPLHMSRSLALFRKAGMHPIASASRLRNGQSIEWWTALPDTESLAISDGALYEYAAWVYYTMKGWV
jgi:uncharacterized SAM-binding protein YcdF (DUF218 family)